MPPIMERPVLRDLTYSSLDWDTHPIDLYDGPQGWGPFNGAWTPWDWHDPAAEIAYTFGHGESNEWQFAPEYDVITVFGDRSADLVYNTSYDAVAQQDAAERELGYSSTISNVVSRPSTMLAKFRQALGVSSDG